MKQQQKSFKNMTVLSSDNYYDRPILVIGAGSIGERHINNLWHLGYRNINVFRQRNIPFRNIKGVKLRVLLDWNEVITLMPFASIIATPTIQHIRQAISCAMLKSHLLIEKPLSNSTEELTFLEEIVVKNKIYLRVGYMMRFHPLIIKLKSIIENEQLGELISFTSKWGEYLPDWHPWEDYKQSYAAKKELGGGVALTLSHDIDLANWLCNSKIIDHITFKNSKSKLEVDTESGVDILLRYENGITGHIHLNYYEKVSERYLRLVFVNGTIIFKYFQNTLTLKTPENNEHIVIENFNRNDLFIAQTKSFFECIGNFSIDESINQINESIQIIKICNDK